MQVFWSTINDSLTKKEVHIGGACCIGVTHDQLLKDSFPPMKHLLHQFKEDPSIRFETKSINAFTLSNNTDSLLILTPGTIIKGENTQDRVLAGHACIPPGEDLEFNQALCGFLRAPCVGTLSLQGALLPLLSSPLHQIKKSAKVTSHCASHQEIQSLRTLFHREIQITSRFCEFLKDSNFRISDSELEIESEFGNVQVQFSNARSYRYGYGNYRSSYDREESETRSIRVEGLCDKRLIEMMRSLCVSEYEWSFVSGFEVFLKKFDMESLNQLRELFYTLSNYERGGRYYEERYHLDRYQRRFENNRSLEESSEVIDLRRRFINENPRTLQSCLWQWTQGSVYSLVTSTPTEKWSGVEFDNEYGMLVVEDDGHYVGHMFGSKSAWDNYKEHFLTALSLFHSKAKGPKEGVSEETTKKVSREDVVAHIQNNLKNVSWSRNQEGCFEYQSNNFHAAQIYWNDTLCFSSVEGYVK